METKESLELRIFLKRVGDQAKWSKLGFRIEEIKDKREFLNKFLIEGVKVCKKYLIQKRKKERDREATIPKELENEMIAYLRGLYAMEEIKDVKSHFHKEEWDTLNSVMFKRRL